MAFEGSTRGKNGREAREKLECSVRAFWPRVEAQKSEGEETERLAAKNFVGAIVSRVRRCLKL